MCFVEASLTVEKAVLCYKPDRFIALLPNFRSVQSPLQGKNSANGATDGCVQTFDACMVSWYPKHNCSYVSSADLVGGYMENLEKPQNCQNWGVGACLGQYSSGRKL